MNTAASAVSGPANSTVPFLRGIGLGLHSKDPEFNYEPLIQEIRQAGAEWIGLFFSMELDNAKGTEFRYPMGERQQFEILAETVAQAHRHHLKTFVFPIVLLSTPGRGEWRGNLSPKDPTAWHRQYRDQLVALAAAARQWQVEGLAIGSEFCSLDSDPEPWRQTIAAVRQVYDGLLTYSVNWDHYRRVTFWSELDLIAVSGYYELSTDPEPVQSGLNSEWRRQRDKLLAWHRQMGYRQPLVFSEIGYPNQDGCSMHPWDYTRNDPPDPHEQAMCYQAFIDAWYDVGSLGGVFFYNWWFNPGETIDRGYSPRGKPAEYLIRDWFARLAGADRAGGTMSAGGKSAMEVVTP